MPDNHHLLNCPFCGRQPREIVKLTIYHSIVCVCGIVITRDTQEEARTTWNTRVPDTELIEAAEKERPSAKLPTSRICGDFAVNV